MSKSEIVREYIDKFGTMPKQTLSRKLNHDMPEIFPTIENARHVVRAVTGSKGKATRQKTKDKTYYDTDNLRKFFEFEDGERFDIMPYELGKNVKKIIILNDPHIPYHDKNAILTALEFASKKEVDAIILNGDVSDYYGISRFIKDPRKRNLNYELDLTKQFLRELRAFFPDKQIYYKEGNHEERWENYLKVAAPVLLDINEFQLDVILQLASLGIIYVKNKKLIKFGKLNILHGHEYKGGGGGVNPARWLFLRTSANSCCGHFHRISQHIERDVAGKQIGCWSMGCLSDLNPEYMPFNNWSQGFGYGEILDDLGHFRFQNKMIENYKVV